MLKSRIRRAPPASALAVLLLFLLPAPATAWSVEEGDRFSEYIRALNTCLPAGTPFLESWIAYQHQYPDHPVPFELLDAKGTPIPLQLGDDSATVPLVLDATNPKNPRIGITLADGRSWRYVTTLSRPNHYASETWSTLPVGAHLVEALGWLTTGAEDWDPRTPHSLAQSLGIRLSDSGWAVMERDLDDIGLYLTKRGTVVLAFTCDAQEYRFSPHRGGEAGHPSRGAEQTLPGQQFPIGSNDLLATRSDLTLITNDLRDL